MDPIGLRLQLRKRQAAAGDIILLYGDESEALTHSYLARAWAKSGANLRVPAPEKTRKVAIAGLAGSRHTSTRRPYQPYQAQQRLPVAHLEQLDHLCGPMPGMADQAGRAGRGEWTDSVSKLSLAALAGRSHWLTVE